MLSGTFVSTLDNEFYARYLKASSYASTDETRYPICVVYILRRMERLLQLTEGILLAWFADERFKSDNDQIIKYDKMLNKFEHLKHFVV